MDLKSIKAIYRFIKSTDIVEIEVEGEGGKGQAQTRHSLELAVSLNRI